ncbi:hypothetical protein ET495_04200 [Xylanimonas allomyrinae]|uniref:IacB n=1 Tax=Xylanimonas allomyrinae TaxID=2509459 RepID=A0A4P6ELK4_9MICO|nr:hypothetical protein [Xylanimonas allomyrinae]QAY62583.1 hypothetical protein ET495_04200 [Xylanimonas allomyrinae]
MSSTAQPMRALVAIGVTERFFAAPESERKAVFLATKTAFAGLAGRFGVRVLGTFDDDTLQIGPSTTFPWTCYLLLEVPGYDEVRAITNVFRETPVGDHQLWRYYKVEARLGRPLFFGEDT